MAVFARQRKLSPEEVNKKRNKIYKKMEELDPLSRKILKQYYSELKQLEHFQKRVEMAEKKLGEIAEPVLEILDQLQDRAVVIDDLLLYAMERKYQSKRPKYKQAIEKVMPYLTEELKKQVEELLKPEYSVRTYIKSKPYSEEGFIDTIKDLGKKTYKKLKDVFKKMATKLKGLLPKFDKGIAELKKAVMASEGKETTSDKLIRLLA